LKHEDTYELLSKREHGGLPLQFRRNNFSFAIKRYLLRNGVARTQQTGRETQQVRNAHPMPISEACSASERGGGELVALVRLDRSLRNLVCAMEQRYNFV